MLWLPFKRSSCVAAILFSSLPFSDGFFFITKRTQIFYTPEIQKLILCIPRHIVGYLRILNH